MTVAYIGQYHLVRANKGVIDGIGHFALHPDIDLEDPAVKALIEKWRSTLGVVAGTGCMVFDTIEEVRDKVSRWV